jgi:hypothetical protein
MWTYLSQRWMVACQCSEGSDNERLTFAGTEEGGLVTAKNNNFSNL